MKGEISGAEDATLGNFIMSDRRNEDKDGEPKEDTSGLEHSEEVLSNSV